MCCTSLSTAPAQHLPGLADNFAGATSRPGSSFDTGAGAVAMTQEAPANPRFLGGSDTNRPRNVSLRPRKCPLTPASWAVATAPSTHFHRDAGVGVAGAVAPGSMPYLTAHLRCLPLTAGCCRWLLLTFGCCRWRLLTFGDPGWVPLERCGESVCQCSGFAHAQGVFVLDLAVG